MINISNQKSYHQKRLIIYVFHLGGTLHLFYKYHPYHLSIQQKLYNEWNALSLDFLFFLIKNWYFALYRSLSYTYILSIYGCWLIKLNNQFVFTDTEPPSINILYVSSGICCQFGLCFFMFCFITSSKLIVSSIVLFYCYS